jgi:hypothetical protein
MASRIGVTASRLGKMPYGGVALLALALLVLGGERYFGDVASLVVSIVFSVFARAWGYVAAGF